MLVAGAEGQSEKRIRLLLVIPTLDQGGAEKQLVHLASHLPPERFDVRVGVLTRTGPLESRLKANGVSVVHIDKKWKVDPFAYRRLAREIEQFQPDIVHTWLFAANAYGRLAALRRRVPVILGGERCVDLWKRPHEFAIDRYLFRRTTGVITNSDGVRRFYAKHGMSADRFHVIPNGIELPEVDLSGVRESLLASLSLGSETRLIGVVARLWPQKRIKDAIWAAELLKCVRDDTHVLIIGDGPQRWRLERYARQVRIDDRVHFLGHRSDALKLIGVLDQFWLCSAYEGQSNALMEAMSQRVPVVASDIPGNRDLVTNEQTGLLYKLGDRAGLARQSRRLLDDPQLAEHCRTKAYDQLSQEFRLDQMVDRHVELYERLLSKASTS